MSICTPRTSVPCSPDSGRDVRGKRTVLDRPVLFYDSY
jgi:hypothetical protein